MASHSNQNTTTLDPRLGSVLNILWQSVQIFGWIEFNVRIYGPKILYEVGLQSTSVQSSARYSNVLCLGKSSGCIELTCKSL